MTLTLAGKKVIVVDADLRRPRQHKLFGLDNAVGASNVAVGDADLVTTLQSVQVVSPDGDGSQADFTSWASNSEGVTKLWVLTSGPIPPNPGEIIASQRFSQMLASLRDECDVLLVDSPAMLAVGDTAALASEVDGLIFLVDMEQARRPVIQAAADQLYRLPCAMMGIVVRSPAHSSRDKYYYTSHYRYSADTSPGTAAGRRAAPSTGRQS